MHPHFGIVIDKKVINKLYICKKSNNSNKKNHKMKKILSVVIITLLSFVWVNGLNAQTLEEAATKYNAAAELSKTDLSGAYEQLKDVYQMCRTIGSEADELKSIVVKLLPTWKYNVANNYVREKDYASAINQFAELANDTILNADADLKEKAVNQLVKLLFVQGNSQFRSDQNEEAIKTFDKALEYDSTYAVAYLMKGQAYRKINDEANMMVSYENAKKFAEITGDEKTLDNANLLISATYLSEANSAYKDNDYTTAYEKSKVAAEVKNDNVEAFYMLAISSNLLNKYDDAISAAQRGAELSGEELSKTARFNFELAKAYEAKGDTNNACSFYKKSFYGPFEEAAKHKVNIELKCN